MPDNMTTLQAPPTQETAAPKIKGELTPEYVAELRRENQERRHESTQLTKSLEETTKKLQETENNTKKALEEVQNLNKKAEQKMIRADVKVFANKYGLRDIEDIKLADLSSIQVDSNGDVSGVEEAFMALKEKKPYLFGEITTSNSGGVPSASVPNKFNPDKVKNMSAGEYAIYEADWLSSLS